MHRDMFHRALRRGIAIVMPAAALAAVLLAAACAAPVDTGTMRRAAAPDADGWVLVIVTARARHGVRIDRMTVASREACSAIEQVVTTMRAAGVDRTTTARCEPGDAAI
jgi:hypothetical protein